MYEYFLQCSQLSGAIVLAHESVKMAPSVDAVNKRRQAVVVAEATAAAAARER